VKKEVQHVTQKEEEKESSYSLVALVSNPILVA